MLPHEQAAVAAAHDKKAVPVCLGGGVGVLAQQPGVAQDLEAWMVLAGRTLQATRVCAMHALRVCMF